MTRPLPAVFVSHGSPMLVLDESAAHHFLKGMSDLVPAPKDILVISAHWETETPRVSLATQPETIYDFRGFPQPLYNLTYPAPGDPQLAARIADVMSDLEHLGLIYAPHVWNIKLELLHSSFSVQCWLWYPADEGLNWSKYHS